MSSPLLDVSPRPPGLLGTIAAGYRLATGHGRQLLSVLVPVLATGLLARTLLDLLAGRDHLVIVDGVPGEPDGAGLAWARLALMVTCWLVALAATALVAVGAERGHAVRPGRAVRAAVRHLPVFAIDLIVAAGAGLFLLWAATGLAGSIGGPAGVALVLVAVLVAGVIAARMLVGLLTHHLGGDAWAMTRGRVTRTAGAFLLGGGAVPLLLTYLSDRLPIPPVAAPALEALVLTVTIAAQAGLLAHLYLIPGPAAADLAVADPLLAELSGGPPRRPWIAAAVAVLAVLTPAGFAAVNPFGLPTVRSHGGGPAGAVAVAWPAGRHPVIATISGAWFCDDDACDRFTDQNGGPPAMEGYGTASISTDGGTVVKAALTGSQDKGGPFIHYARCTRDGCTEAYVPVRATAREAFGWAELAGAAAPDGSIWFVLAMPSDESAPGKATYRITLVHCAQIGCAKPVRHDAGTVQRRPDVEDRRRQRVRLSIGADGRPVATIRTGDEAVVVTCDPVTCAAPRSTWTWVGQPGTPWVAPASPTRPVVSVEPGVLRIGERILPLPGGGTLSEQSGAVAVEGSHFYAAAAEETTRPGLHVRVGVPTAAPSSWRQVLWRCDQAACRRQVLDGFDLMTEPELMTGPELMAAATDGRVLIVRPDRIVLVSAPARQ